MTTLADRWGIHPQQFWLRGEHPAAPIAFDDATDERERVRADRSTVPLAIEESLRFLTPFAAVARATTEAVDIAGQQIPPDQMMMIWLSAANRDPRRFDNPDTFDAARDPNPHIGFGRGIHFCVGAPLARLEGRIAINILLDRFPNLRLDPETPPTFMPSPNMTGVQTLPMLA